MPEHIQRDYLRKLLRAIGTWKTPEQAADIIIDLINKNYELKSPRCSHCGRQDDNGILKCTCENESQLNALENQSPEC